MLYSYADFIVTVVDFGLISFVAQFHFFVSLLNLWYYLATAMCS